MDADQQDIVGKWTVKFKAWIWEYTFADGGTVTWRDPLNGEGGSGRWAKSGKIIYLSWSGSTTKESWNCPIRQTGQDGWVAASYGSGKLEAQKAISPQLGINPGVPVDSAIANVPWERYVDLFSECTYDANYKIPPNVSFAFSSVLQLRYPDGTAIELDIDKDFVEQSMTSEAARDAMARGRLGAGGRIFPSVVAARTVPRLWAARQDAYRVQDEYANQFAMIATTGVAFVLSVPAMPAGMIEEATIAGTRVNRRRTTGVGRGAGAAGARVKPLNGKVSVGGGFENRDGTNLNPINPNSGGPSRNIPNHVLGRMEDMDKLFEPASVRNMISSKLRFVDVNWTQGTNAAAKVMAPGGKVSMNVWCQSGAEEAVLRDAFTRAGFRNVRVTRIGMDGSSTMVFADF